MRMRGERLQVSKATLILHLSLNLSPSAQAWDSPLFLLHVKKKTMTMHYTKMFYIICGVVKIWNLNIGNTDPCSWKWPRSTGATLPPGATRINLSWFLHQGHHVHKNGQLLLPGCPFHQEFLRDTQ